jgi:hypothetical protein
MSASVSRAVACGEQPTNLIEHLVALVQDEVVDVGEPELLVADQGVQAARSAHNDVRVGVLVGEDFVVLLYRSAAVEDRRLDGRHVLGEPGVLVADLVRQLAGVAHDQNGRLASDRLYLLQTGEHEDGRLSETALGLAHHVGSENGLRNDLLLNCTRSGMLDSGSMVGYEGSRSVRPSARPKPNVLPSRVFPAVEARAVILDASTQITSSRVVG